MNIYAYEWCYWYFIGRLVYVQYNRYDATRKQGISSPWICSFCSLICALYLVPVGAIIVVFYHMVWWRYGMSIGNDTVVCIFLLTVILKHIIYILDSSDFILFPDTQENIVLYIITSLTTMNMNVVFKYVLGRKGVWLL